METMYTEELRSSVNLLMANLESQPVAKDFKPKIKPKLTPMNSFLDMGEEGDLPLSKSDVVLSFTLEVRHMGTPTPSVLQAKGAVWHFCCLTTFTDTQSTIL